MNSTEWNEIRKRVAAIKNQLANGFAAFYEDEYVTDLNMEDEANIRINLLPSKDQYVFLKVNTLSQDVSYQSAADMLRGFQLVGGRKE